MNHIYISQVGLGLADAVVDLVETGTTMRAAGLEIVSTILSTEAVLLSNPNTKKQALVDMIASRIDGYMTAKRYVVCVCVCGSLTQRCFVYHIGSLTYSSDSTHSFSSLLFSSLSPSSLFLDLSLPSRTTTTTNSYALISYNVKRDDLDFAVQITPGLSSPTVQPLAPIKGRYVFIFYLYRMTTYLANIMLLLNDLIFPGVKWCSVSAMVARKEVGVAMDKLKALGATGVIVFNLDNCRV